MFNYSCPHFPHYSPLPYPSPPPTLNVSPPCWLCPWALHTCSLTWPFPFFPPLSHSPLPSATVSLVLSFCLWNYWLLYKCKSFYTLFCSELRPLPLIHSILNDILIWILFNAGCLEIPSSVVAFVYSSADPPESIVKEADEIMVSLENIISTQKITPSCPPSLERCDTRSHFNYSLFQVSR